MRSDEIDYKIIGDDMQAVIITLDPDEVVIAEAGALLYKDAVIDMATSLSTGKDEGLFGKLFSAGKRMLTGESFFITHFGNTGRARAEVAFGGPYPGKIIPMDLSRMGGELLCQKDSFLCAARGIDVDIAFTKKLGVGFFGGEGFILQRLKGDGLAFVHAGGHIEKKTLGVGQTLHVDTGCLVAIEPSVHYDIKFVGGIKNALFGGEGLFFAEMTGPGDIWLQTLPFSRMADRILACAPKAGGKSKGEGSILGGIGRLLDGDNR
ncbi:MAG: TIGR00266 family protein [Planctomycetes bacterium]|nr:TIGR00266 family protein [Planctomycetota bacterium]